ncbi:retrotransposon protein, putative, ty1-copia subclass [Tanacetum coccineum]|uniref:Retrotransposon protein, putative, ty1-copia subclass n=1 Tax=Tanacetum coccineum TaxID=301880 RepID=A0ABQ4X4S0_9ASTR
MFKKEKLSGNNFNDWFARLKLVLRVEKKMHVIEQPLPPAPEPVAEPDIVAQWTALYDAHTEIACLMLGIEGKPVADYVLKMKGYVEILERLGYVLLQDITVVLIFNGLTKDFVDFSGNNPEGQKKSLNAKGNNKVKGKGNDKKVYIPKPKNPTPSAWRAPSKDVLLPPTVRGRSTGKGSCPIRRSKRTLRATNRLCLNVEVEEHSLGDLGEPANYTAAMLDPKSKKWVDVMNAEMQSMIDNMVWVLVDLPPNCKTVGSKWIFKKKTDMDGNVHIYKAR